MLILKNFLFVETERTFYYNPVNSLIELVAGEIYSISDLLMSLF